ncbi:lipopolysaccharide cholinephosphotransferase [Eubacterium ruminantium]|nr:lipopolysaccharide cholinephosphotransferase [Eubacterium ruminantium]
MEKMTLKEIQETDLNLMVEFDKVCRKYGLRYTLCAGSLIGAIRHEGFIPWDDDVDISMPRPDYEKLIRLNRKNNLFPDYMRLACFEDGTLDAPYMKIFDTRTRIKEEHYKQKDVSSLWIDIFPVDGLPASERKTRFHYKIGMILVKLNIISVVKLGYGKSGLKIVLKAIFLRPLARLIGRKKIAKLQRKVALKYSYNHSPRCGMVSWAYDGPGQVVEKEKYENLIEVPFEGHKFYSMKGYDEYLTGIFGDYMTPPPEEDRLTHELEAYYEG